MEKDQNINSENQNDQSEEIVAEDQISEVEQNTSKNTRTNMETFSGTYSF